MYAIRSYYEHGDDVAGEDLAGGGQLQPAGQALEQRCADLLLQFQDLPVHCRRGDIQRTVITSYSIHYTKLYDSFLILWWV